MTKHIVAAVVAGIVIMAWQTASHTFLQMHASQEQYTPNQDVILKVLSENLDKQGQYYLPNVPPGTSMEEMEKVMEENMGKPYATILYSPKNETSMPANLLRGLGTNILLGFVLAWLMRKIKVQTFRNILTASMLVGFISFCFYPYPAFIWYQTPGIWMELADSVAAFTLAGLWLGWWMTRKKA
jgi:hypothetical protein